MATTAGVRLFKRNFTAQDSGVATPQEISELLVREAAAIPQILRQGWIIFGEFYYRPP